jgi:hypothetical protein
MRGEGDDNKDGQEAGVLEALPMDRAMAVTFSHISCWVRKTAEPPSLIARAKRIGKAQDEQPLRQVSFVYSKGVAMHRSWRALPPGSCRRPPAATAAAAAAAGHAVARSPLLSSRRSFSTSAAR